VDGGEVTIGRENDRQITLPSAAVSRRHAKIVLSGPQPYIVDEGSANGVIVNGVRIAGPTAVVPGVRVDIAEFYLEFEMPGMGGPQTAAVAPISGQPRPQGGAEEPLRLLATGGPFDGRLYDLTMPEMGVGRAMDNELVLDDPSLSRKHARMRRVGPNRIELEDLGSSNGTFVNGRKLSGKATAGPGDTVRFGDLIFKMQGPRAEGTRAVGVGGGGSRNILLFGGIGVAVLGAAVAVILLLPSKKSGGSSKEEQGKKAELAAMHVENGKAKLADKKFDAAIAEFEQALEFDPNNADAQKYKDLAANEPEYEKKSKLVSTKLALGDRSALEAAARIVQRKEIPEESSFAQSTAKKVSDKLLEFSSSQCKARKYADCAWAVCKALEIAPASSRPGADDIARLNDAEKKLTKDKSYTKCKAKR
jgi:pSer/pThr/pTyr-binding forkhead associated (FHA) protein